MNLFRKFYNTDAPSEAVPSIASIAAKSGVLRQPGEEGAIPSINTTEKKEEPITAPAPPATATDAKPAEEAKPATPSPKQDPIPEPPQAAAPEVKVPSWQEVLKQQQPSAILKELGLDERLVDLKELEPKMVGFLSHWKSKGDPKQYLEALTTDFTKMQPEEVMRYQLRMQNPELNDKQLDTLYKIKVTQRYKLDSQLFSEEDVEEGRVELMADVKSVRNALIAEQEKFLLPTAPEPKAAEPDSRAQQQKQDFEEYQSLITNSDYTKNIVSSKKIILGEGEDQVSIPVNGEALLQNLLDSNTWTQKLFKKEELPNGNVRYVPDIQKQMLISAILEDDKAFFSEYAKHFKLLGSKSAIEPIENAKPPVAGTPAKAETSEGNPAAQMAKRGRLVSGGY